MTALASISDYEAVTGSTVAPTDEARITRLLELASDAVLAGAHGQTIIEATYTAEVLYPHDGIIYFPQRPVTDVDAVVVNGTTIDAADYRFTSGGDRLPAKLVRRVNGYDTFWAYGYSNSWGEVAVTVTYTAGWPSIPGQIVAAVCSMAKGVVDNAGGARRSSVGVGPFTSSFDPTDTTSSSLAITPTIQAMLDRLCGVDAVGSVATPRGTP